jgi:Tfp pilus assembly protein PilW
MGRIGDTAAALGRSERGYTLIELLVATMMGFVVVGGAVTVFVGALHSEPRASSKADAIVRGRIAVERITRDVRQGADVVAASPSQLELVTYLPQASCVSTATKGAEACRVRYACAAGKCSRTVSRPDGSAAGAAVLVAGELSSNEVFSYAPSGAGAVPSYVGVELSFAMREGGPVVIADGASLRNGGA